MVTGQIAIVIQSSNLSTEQLGRIANALTLNMFGASTIYVVPLDISDISILANLLAIK